MLHKLLELLAKKRQEMGLYHELIVSILDSQGWSFRASGKPVPGYEHKCLLCTRAVRSREPQWVSPDGRQRIHNDVSCWVAPR